MKTKILLLSLATIAIIGCGGTNNGACCGSGFKAVGEGKIVADNNNNITPTVIHVKKIGASGERTEESTSTITITGIGSGSDCPSTNPCTVNATQKTSCPDKKDKPAFVNLSDCEKDEAKAKISYDPNSEIIVYGGTIDISEENQRISDCDIDAVINIPGDLCGKEIESGKTAGFGGEYKDNKVYALISVTGECSTREQIWVEGTIKGNKVTFPGLKNITLPATFSLFRVTPIPPHLTSGATGSSGSTGSYGG